MLLTYISKVYIFQNDSIVNSAKGFSIFKKIHVRLLINLLKIFHLFTY
jgi:hypothetical protein